MTERRPVVLRAFPRRLMWVAILAGLAGCAGGPDALQDGRLDADRSASADEGAMIAARACGTCHALGEASVSSWPGAPPFKTIHLDLNAISYERRLAQLHAGQDRGMPPAALTQAELRSLQAYIASLRR